MIELRPTLTVGTTPGLGYEATYFRVYEAVKGRRRLIHGRLRDEAGHTCAIGAYFEEAKIPIDTRAIAEIAAYNDSFPGLCPSQRWRKVMAWLKTRIPARGGA